MRAAGSLGATWHRAVLAVAYAASAASAATAQVPSQSVGAPVSVVGGITAVGQATTDDRARSEVVGSLDLFITVPFRRLWLHMYVEGNTTPFRNGVSRIIGEANTDAGTALDRRRRGRVQLSEVRLVAPVADELRLHGGLLDATGFLDVSRIANDENIFFLGVPFVNNPTIDFPDYAIGVALEGALPGADGWEVGAAVTSSNGLADNPNVSYTQLLSLDDEEKGVFAGAALRWEGDGKRVSVGAWTNTADRERLDGGPEPQTNRGAFAVGGWFDGDHSVSARAGVADPSVALASAFLGVTYLWARRPNALGLAVGRSFASGDAAGTADVTQAEAFVRRRLLGEVFVTASVQRIGNPGFDATGATTDPSVWVGSLRLSTQF